MAWNLESLTRQTIDMKTGKFGDMVLANLTDRLTTVIERGLRVPEAHPRAERDSALLR